MRIQLENTVYTIRMYVWNFDLKKIVVIILLCISCVRFMFRGMVFFYDFPCENNVQNCALDRYFLGFQRFTSPFLRQLNGGA